MQAAVFLIPDSRHWFVAFFVNLKLLKTKKDHFALRDNDP